MKSVILYAYPPEPDGLSMQGHMLYLGLKENGESVEPCHVSAEFQKEWLYRYFKPDAAVGIGYWGHTPDLILHTQKCGVIPVPWFVADGWVANYHEVLNSLPLALVTSDWVKKTYTRDGVDTKNFETVPIGFDLELFRPIPKKDPRIVALRKQLGIKNGDLMILTAGGDVTSKGAQEILKALRIVDQEFSANGGNWKYILKVWGGGSADDHYDAEQKLIEELGDSADKVRYIDGPLSHEFMPILLNAADIYAAPSRLEGFGMVQVEAQACGIPVISINEMGPKETIVHEKTGFLAKVASTVELAEELAHTGMGFEKDHKVQFEKPKIFAYRADVDELARYLALLLKDPDLRERMGRAGREHTLKNFAYRDIAKKIADLMKEKLKLN